MPFVQIGPLSVRSCSVYLISEDNEVLSHGKADNASHTGTACTLVGSVKTNRICVCYKIKLMEILESTPF